MHRLFTLASLSVSSLLLGLSATSAKADSYLDKCIAAGSGSSSHHYKCATEFMAREDKALNQTWRRVYGSLDDGIAKTALLEEQRAWIKYKDASCELYEDSAQFGSIGWSVSRPMCKIKVIQQRIRELEGYYKAIR
ncbi:MAG: DUF1311 domain-containing protein [Erythrobacter sp.]|jgi:uncharacterized protein YecT (DUF1311 family)|uniref:lysozyme inhibitor LprI family protein n=1 Tax=Qipengyuania pacifica TaxID=2860199 RepID=UPI0035C854A0|nr:DUF1311 domain-containing protein [Erythrobacter sp.]